MSVITRQVVASTIAVVVCGSLGSAAFAETYGVPGVAEVGTDGSNGYSGDEYPACCPAISVSQGGCTWGTYLSVAIGDNAGGCGDGEAHSLYLAVGLLGADASTFYDNAVAVTDSGSADGGVAVSVTGAARSHCLPSETGCVAVSGTGAADAPGCGAHPWASGVAVSGTGDASGCTAVSGGELLP
jgi:hypothetical protein